MPKHKATNVIIALSAWLLCITFHTTSAQSQTYPFKQFPLPHDLPNIERMFEDHQGYIWLGTAEGLYRFDGINYLLFTSSDPHRGLGREVITCMYEDQDQVMWIGAKSGLFRYDRGRKDFQKFSFGDDMYPTNISQQKDSSFLVLCRVGIFRFYPTSGKWIPVHTGINKSMAYAMVHGHHDDLWIGSDDIVRRFDLKSNSYQDYPLPVPSYAKPGEKLMVSSMYMDGREQLWINTWYKGLVIIDTHTGKTTLLDTVRANPGKNLMEIFVSSFAEDEEGNIWLANTNRGVNIYHPNDDTISTIREGTDFSYGLKGSDFIVMADREKNIWVKSDLALHFLSRMSPSPFRVSDPKLNIHDALCMEFVTPEYILVGTYFGLFGVNPITNKSTCLNNLLQLPVTHNAEFQSTPDVLILGKELWASSPQGLRLVRRSETKGLEPSFTFRQLFPIRDSFFPTKLIPFRDSLIFVKGRINTSAFATFNTASGTYTYYTLPDSMLINDAMPVRADTILLAIRNKGMYYYSLRYEELHPIPWAFEEQDIPMINPVFFKIVSLKDGHYALCSENYSLMIFDPQKQTFKHVDVSQLVNTNRVYSVEEDAAHNLWIQASNQLLYYKRKEDALLKINMSNSFGGNMPYFFMKDGRQLYATYDGGLYTLDPAQLFFKTQKPGLFLESIKSRDHELTWNSATTLKIDYEDNFLTFDFTGLDFDNPQGISYWYKIPEINEDWQFLGNQPSVRFGNLSPGKYHFILKASNDAGIWSDEVHAPEIIIRPPVWRRWWFLSVMAVVIISIAFYIIRIRRLRQETEIRLRNQIAKDLHDDIGSTLSGIKIFSVIASGMSGDHQELSALLQQIRDKSDLMMQSMSDIVWSINPAHDSLQDMMIRLKQYMAEVLESQDVEVHFSAPADSKSLKIDLRHRKEMYLAFKEIINNAAKYAACTNFYFEIRKEKGHILALIRDDGRGMETDHEHSGNGLKNIESRILQTGGQITRNSAPGTGVKYEIRIPIT